MTMIESHRVYIGARGWLHSGWDENFYPEDLPQDWQLAYYGNEFPVVLVTEKEWQQAGDVEEWLNDTDDTPLFICEIPLHNLSDNLVSAAEVYLDKIRQLDQRCLGIICHVNQQVSADELDALLQKCNALAPTCVESHQPCSNALLDIFRQQSVNLVWNRSGETEEVNGSLLVATISSQDINLKVIRQRLDSLLKYDDQQHTLVLLVDDDANVEIIRQAKMMLELM